MLFAHRLSLSPPEYLSCTAWTAHHRGPSLLLRHVLVIPYTHGTLTRTLRSANVDASFPTVTVSKYTLLFSRIHAAFVLLAQATHRVRLTPPWHACSCSFVAPLSNHLLLHTNVLSVQPVPELGICRDICASTRVAYELVTEGDGIALMCRLACKSSGSERAAVYMAYRVLPCAGFALSIF